jgi:glycosyltransferase involved in cell wall biosynthesis
MRVGVVASELEGQPTGVGRYLSGLLSGVAELDPGWDWVLFFHGERLPHAWEGARGFEARFAGGRGRPVVWEQVKLPRLLRGERLDLVFSPSYSLPPLGGLPGVVTLHDLSFEILPGEFSLRERWRRRILARRAARQAARVLVDAARVGEEVHERLRVPRDRIGVVPLGVDAGFASAAAGGRERDAAVLAGLGVEPPYLLFVGSLFERRNPRLQLELLAALRRDRPRLSLVFAGPDRLRRRRELEQSVGELGMGANLRCLGFVPEAAVAPLYRGAELSLYLSSYEGFGLPPLESLACGTPAVVGPGTALDELWPGYPYRSPGLDLTSVLPLAAGALDDAEGRRRVGLEGASRMARLSWKRSAEILLGELEKAARR